MYEAEKLASRGVTLEAPPMLKVDRSPTGMMKAAVYVPGGVLSTLGVYSGKLELPVDAYAAGLGDFTVVSRLCPGGKERMRRLLALVASGRADLRALVTHRFPLDRIEEAYDLFANGRDGVLKVAISVGAVAVHG